MILFKIKGNEKHILVINYLDKAIVEEETDSCRHGDECLLKFSGDGSSDNAFDVGAGIFVIIELELGRHRGR